uniref:transposase n=1 Tax=Escherichia coli TaxID=562 RepID=UPI00218078F5
NDVTLKMPAFEWVHVQLHQQKGMISLSPPTICNSALNLNVHFHMLFLDGVYVEQSHGSARFRWVKAPTSPEL